MTQTKPATPLYFALFNQYIVTANADGSVPLNSKCVIKVGQLDSVSMLTQMLSQANAYPELVAALRDLLATNPRFREDKQLPPYSIGYALLAKLGEAV